MEVAFTSIQWSFIPQFRGNTETKFCTTHSDICISLALFRFSDELNSIIGRNRFKLRPFTTTEMRTREFTEVHRIYEVHMKF